MLALVAARREELAAVLRLRAWRQRRAPEGALAYQRRDHAVSALLTGAGRDQTERAMAWLLESQRPDSILALGFAGACTANLDIGDMVLATRLHHIEGHPFDWDSDPPDPTPAAPLPSPSSHPGAPGEPLPPLHPSLPGPMYVLRLMPGSRCSVVPTTFPPAAFASSASSSSEASVRQRPLETPRSPPSGRFRPAATRYARSRGFPVSCISRFAICQLPSRPV